MHHSRNNKVQSLKRGGDKVHGGAFPFNENLIFLAFKSYKAASIGSRISTDFYTFKRSSMNDFIWTMQLLESSIER
jgi:hypothetical protein